MPQSSQKLGKFTRAMWRESIREKLENAKIWHPRLDEMGQLRANDEHVFSITRIAIEVGRVANVVVGITLKFREKNSTCNSLNIRSVDDERISSESSNVSMELSFGNRSRSISNCPIGDNSSTSAETRFPLRYERGEQKKMANLKTLQQWESIEFDDARLN